MTVISAADIRLNGWQTLADILNTLPGFSITNDYTYNYAAARGLAISGDWRSRMQILIHGISTNENIYHSERNRCRTRRQFYRQTSLSKLYGSSGTIFNDSNHFERYSTRLAELGYLLKSGTAFPWDTRLYYGNYKYDG